MAKCHDCGKEFTGETYLCGRCAKRKNLSSKKSRLAKEKMGKCTKCGIDLIDTRYKMCEECREYYRSRMARKPKMTKDIVVRVFEKKSREFGVEPALLGKIKQSIVIELELMGY